MEFSDFTSSFLGYDCGCFLFVWRFVEDCDVFSLSRSAEFVAECGFVGLRINVDNVPLGTFFVRPDIRGKKVAMTFVQEDEAMPVHAFLQRAVAFSFDFEV